MEPWDGPAGIVPSDGRYVACNLDTETDYALLVMWSQRQPNQFRHLKSVSGIMRQTKWQRKDVGPGELLVIDTRRGKLWQSNEIDNDLKGRHLL